MQNIENSRLCIYNFEILGLALGTILRIWRFCNQNILISRLILGITNIEYKDEHANSQNSNIFSYGIFQDSEISRFACQISQFEIWHAIIKLKDLTGRTIESWIFCMSKYLKFKTWVCMQNIWIPRCNMLNIKISDLTCRISKYQGLALTMKTSSFNCSNIWHDEYWNIFSRISVNILQKNIFPASRGRLSRRGKKEAFLPRRERPLQTGKKYSAYSSYQFSDYA